MTFDTETEEFLIELENSAKGTNGPTIYLIRSLKVLVKSNAITIQASKKVEEAVKHFEVSTRKSQNFTLILTSVGILVAIAQLILAIVIWLK